MLRLRTAGVVGFLLPVLWACLEPFTSSAAVQAIREPQDTEQWMVESQKLLSAGRLSEAIAVLKSVKEQAPEDSRPYFYTGVALAEGKHLEQAAAELQEARRIDPAQPVYAVAYAHVLSLLGRDTEALEALALFEKEAYAGQLVDEWLWLLCDVYYRLDKSQEASGILDLHAARNPQDQRIKLRRGQISVQEGDLETARSFFLEAVEENSGAPEPYFELGKALWLSNELTASRKHLLEAVRLAPANPEYIHQLATVLLALGDTKEAIEYLRRVENSGRYFPEIYRALGEAYRVTGQKTISTEYFKKFQETNSRRLKEQSRQRQAFVLIYQGEAELEKGMLSNARRYFEQALEVAPGSWLAHANLVELYLSWNPVYMPRAYQHLRKMEEIEPDSVEGNILMAFYWYKSKDLQQARAYAERMKTIRPGNAELRNLLGNIYFELGQHDKALEEYAAAVQFAPERSDFQSNYESVYRQHNK